MNRKILAVMAIAFVAIGIGAVSAFDSGSNNNQTVKIDEIEFNVPEGFVENTTLELTDQHNSKAGVDYITNGKTYEKGQDAVSILVADYGEHKLTDQIAASVGQNKTTINGIDGYISMTEGYYVFNYIKDNKMVIVSSTDEDIISDFLIA